MEFPQKLPYQIEKLSNSSKIEEEALTTIISYNEETDISLTLCKKKSFEEFLGDELDSTEISSLLAGFDASFVRSDNRPSLESETTESVSEILNILKVPNSTKNKKIDKTKLINLTPFQQRPKTISLNGKVLSNNMDAIEKSSPVRSSNPFFKNFNSLM